jgi:hypothetical protein
MTTKTTTQPAATTRLRVISLGWGVQSFTLAAMVALGELEPVDAAIHADTTHERSATYAFAALWTAWLQERGVNVVTVVSKNVQPVQMVTSQWTDIPAYTDTGKSLGQLRRQCTGSWKIAALRRWLQANRNGAPVEQWIGISLDEWQRMKDSDVKYVTHRWPLIERRMTRHDCANWLRAHDLPVPPKSSCVFCPYHNRAAWQEMASEGGADWHKAVEIDRAIRKVRPPYDLFIHSSRKPLDSLDLRTPQERGQMELWANWDAECSGVCGV